MTELNTLGERLRHAALIYAQRQPGKRIDHAQFGQAVGAIEGTGPHSADTVYSWFSNEAVPAYSTMLAIAELVGRKTDAQIGQLIYGPEWPIHGLNESDYRRFHHTE